VVYRLADVVQQGALRAILTFGAELRGHHATKVGDLYGVGEDVLAVGGAILQAPRSRIRSPCMPPRSCVVEGLATGGLYLFLDLLFGLGDDLLYAPRVDAPVLHQPLHRHAAYLAPHRVEGTR
jgi:hypothetical protein